MLTLEENPTDGLGIDIGYVLKDGPIAGRDYAFNTARECDPGSKSQTAKQAYESIRSDPVELLVGREFPIRTRENYHLYRVIDIFAINGLCLEMLAEHVRTIPMSQ